MTMTERAALGSQLALYGHPFSSYTWKGLIPLYAQGLDFDFRVVGEGRAEHDAMLAKGGPLVKFPLLVDGDRLVFEATTIIEHLALHHPGPHMLMPAEPDAAIHTRMIDRVFDNYVMGSMQEIVNERIRNPESPDAERISGSKAKLDRVYAWLEEWLADRALTDEITLVECAAGPSLFYTDWVHPIGDAHPRLRRWRAHLLGLPPVSRCVEGARPYRHYFPGGAPNRD